MNAPPDHTLKRACETLASADKALARAYDEIDVPAWRSGEASYAAIARMLTYQQISTKAAGSIWGRVRKRYGDLKPEIILAATEDELRACGLSRPKVRYLKAVAEALVTGQLNFQRVLAAPVDAAHKELISVTGIGPWTAELFLLYAGNMDAFPPGDVGLMEAHRLLLRCDTRLDTKSFSNLAETWRPFRGVAAHLLWGWINMRRANEDKPSPQA